jgi:hypothetical protein
MRKTPAPMMTAPANAARILCWETDVRLIDPFCTDDQPEQAGVDGPLLDTAEERTDLRRPRQTVVRGDVEAGANELGDSPGTTKRLRDHRTSWALCRDRVSRTSPMVRTNVTLNVTLRKEVPDQGG